MSTSRERMRRLRHKRRTAGLSELSLWLPANEARALKRRHAMAASDGEPAHGAVAAARLLVYRPEFEGHGVDHLAVTDGIRAGRVRIVVDYAPNRPVGLLAHLALRRRLRTILAAPVDLLTRAQASDIADASADNGAAADAGAGAAVGDGANAASDAGEDHGVF